MHRFEDIFKKKLNFTHNIVKIFQTLIIKKISLWIIFYNFYNFD